MKASMADDGEEFVLFTVGTIVSCKTCFNQEFEGEVLAFDYQTKMLLIKSPSTGGKANISDVHMINLDYCQNIAVKKEGNPTSNGPQILPPLNVEKLSNRFARHVKERKNITTALNAGVSSDGIKLYLAIKKTISEVTFQLKTIMVMNQVSITPPYRPENCKLVGKADENALNHVRKILLLQALRMGEKEGTEKLTSIPDHHTTTDDSFSGNGGKCNSCEGHRTSPKNDF